MLRRPAERAALCRALEGVQRLVLLGDLLELRHGPLREAMAAAQPVLQEIAAALPASAEVVIVPGNHDHRLLREWFERRGSDGVPDALALEHPVDWQGDEPLARIVRWLSPARVRASYPGVWLRDDVYAIHGHYGDRHSTVPMLERLGAGAMARIVGEPLGGPGRAEDYEAVLAPVYAFIDEVAQHGGVRLGPDSQSVSTQAWNALSAGQRGGGVRRRATVAAFGAVVAVLSRAGTGQLRPDLSSRELRRAGLRACGEVLVRLGVSADHVIFGHTHRAGPLPRDDRSEWRAPSGSALLNSGSWLYDRSFLGPEPRRSPYRPGFAVTLAGDEPPRLVNLLDPAPG